MFARRLSSGYSGTQRLQTESLDWDSQRESLEGVSQLSL